MAFRKCIIKTCDNDATPRTVFCQNCGAGINSWSHRRVAERLERRRKLGIYTGRMEVAIEERKKR
jgi:hypothetical protein